MRKERLTYRDLLRRILVGRLLRREERRRAEEILAIPDAVEVALRLGALLESVADRGGLIRLGRRPGERRNLERYLDPATNDTWTIELPGPGVVHDGAAVAAEPAPAAPPGPPPAAAPEPEPEKAPPAPPRLVRPVRDVDVAPGVARRFLGADGEPLRTLTSTFAPCRTPEDLAESLAPLRGQLLERTSADDVRFHVVAEPEGTLAPLPVRDQPARSFVPLGARVVDGVLGERRGLHVPNLAAADTGARPEDRGALVSLPLVSGERVVGILEVIRDRPGAFEEDELALFALAASTAGGAVVGAEILERLIFLDRLTGLYNRAYFDDQIEREIERANRMGTSVALFMADLDRFKSINDRFGHLAGDRALAHLASIIRANIRQIDVAARYGGEEFAILLPAITRPRAEHAAERLRRVVADSRFGEVVPELGDERVSISLGFALYPDDAATAKQLIDRADRVALYAAKSRGRNRVVGWAAVRSGGERLESRPG